MASRTEHPNRAPKPNSSAARAEALSRASTALRETEPEPVPQQALVVDPERPKKSVKTEIRYFVSYSREERNRKLAKDLLDRLKDRFASCSGFRFVGWLDENINPGDHWQTEIEKAIDRCHFGLLLVSYQFLASPYITEKELPHFVAADEESPEPKRRAVPVGLLRLPFDGSADLKGLKERQVFLDAGGMFYGDRAGQATRDRFAEALYQRILAIVRKHLAAPLHSLANACEGDDSLARLEKMQLLAIRGFPGFVPPRGVRASLDKKLELSESPVVSSEQVDAVEFLTEWAADPQAPAFCALLGEYGMGKTTTCEAFSRRLLEERLSKPKLPVPIYLDLRHLGDTARSNPFLDEILLIVGARSHATGRSAKESPRPDEIMSLVQSGRAIAIFDGLDEVLVHLTPSQGQRFTRELWRVSPPRLLPAKGKAQAEKPGGKVLISCRTHYFRTIREEQTHFLGEGREKIAASDYRALILLPFTTDQIEEYLAKNLPEQDLEKLLELIRSVHNLEELAERPYTLKLIAEHIPRLEQWKLEGRNVTSVTLYREMVTSWLERDIGKHTLTMDHKLSLMERLAAELWLSGKRAWAALDVEQWLLNFLAENPQIKLHYEGKDRELLKEDLRTATFLVRDGEDGFRFAHTSLQEFFLAAHLHRALREGRFEAWQIPMPSPETLDFLGQLIAEKGEAEALAKFRELRDKYRPQASELMLAYALRARKKEYPSPALAGFRLDGAQLKNWTIAAPESATLLDMEGASFNGANLKGARLSRIDASAADFGGADLTCAEWVGGKGKETRFGESVLVGTVFRDLDLTSSDFSRAKLYRTQWLRCGTRASSGLDSTVGGLFAGCIPEIRDFQGPRQLARLVVLLGHRGSVTSCTFSPNGLQLASTGDDGALRIWDVATGEVCQVLEGHRGSVSSCAFSPEGSYIASTGEDGSLRLWDAASGESLFVLEGHLGSVLSCAFFLDGSRLASAGNDGSIRLWDTNTGKVLRVLEGHKGAVFSCTFSLDGSRLASAGDDGSVRLWDEVTGQTLQILKGHRGSVRSCGFFPDAFRLASAGDDGFLRVWDTATGEILRVLKGHEGAILSCSFSRDGSRLVSAGDDGSLRLWDAATGETLQVLEGHRGSVRTCAFSPEGSCLASAGDDGSIRLWDRATGKALRALKEHRGSTLSCTFSPDGSRLASAGDDGSLRLWDAATGEASLVLKGHYGSVESCAYSHDGSWLASTGSDFSVRLWNTATGEASLVLEGHEGPVWSCAFSPDGSQLASAGVGASLRLWNPETGDSLGVLEANSVWVCVFSPDSSWLATAGAEGRISLWETSSLKALRVLEGHRGPVWSCSFSPNGSQLASAGDDGSLRLWDLETGEPYLVLEGHPGRVLSCAFSPDGSQLASAGDDGALILWDTANGQILRAFKGHKRTVRTCAFSPDGSRLASAGEDNFIRLWDTATGQATGQIQLLPNGEVGSFFGPDLSLSYASPGAWRYLGWLAPDPVTGVITRYPAEIFGPLPGPDSKGGFHER